MRRLFRVAVLLCLCVALLGSTVAFAADSQADEEICIHVIDCNISGQTFKVSEVNTISAVNTSKGISFRNLMEQVGYEITDLGPEKEDDGVLCRWSFCSAGVTWVCEIHEVLKDSRVTNDEGYSISGLKYDIVDDEPVCYMPVYTLSSRFGMYVSPNGDYYMLNAACQDGIDEAQRQIALGMIALSAMCPDRYDKVMRVSSSIVINDTIPADCPASTCAWIHFGTSVIHILRSWAEHTDAKHMGSVLVHEATHITEPTTSEKNPTFEQIKTMYEISGHDRYSASREASHFMNTKDLDYSLGGEAGMEWLVATFREDGFPSMELTDDTFEDVILASGEEWVEDLGYLYRNGYVALDTDGVFETGCSMRVNDVYDSMYRIMFMNGYTDCLTQNEWMTEQSFNNQKTSLTRVKLAEILYNVAGCPRTRGCGFPDNASKSVSWVRDLGFLNGIVDMYFHGESLVSHSEFTSIVARFARAMEAQAAQFSPVA